MDPFEQLDAFRRAGNRLAYDRHLIALVRAAQMPIPPWRTDAFDTLPMAARMAIHQWIFPPHTIAAHHLT